MKNVLIRRLTEPRIGQVATRGCLPEAVNCTFENLDIKVSGTATWENCVINGNSLPEGKPATGADEVELVKLIPKG